MQASVRVTLVLIAWLAVLPAARGQMPNEEAPAPGDVRLPLKMQETLLPPVAPANREELPIFVEADRIQGVQGKDLEAVGNVVVRRRGQVLTADKLYYSIPDNAVTATGHVRVDRLGDVVTGDQAHYDLDTSAGYIERPTYSFRQFGARGKADRLVIVDRDVYRAQRATYTNCAVGDDDWYLRVGKMDLDRLTDVGVAHNASVYFKDVPDLLHALDGLSPDQPAQDRLPAAAHRHQQQQRLRDRGAVLLEHRAQPRLHHSRRA